MSLHARSRITQSARTACRVIDGRAVVIVIDRQQLHTLDGVGTFVWNRAERAVAIDELVDEVVLEFDVAREVAQADVLRFAGELVSAGALDVVDGA